MPMKKRNWKQEYKTQVERGEDSDQLERQRARRKLDAKGISRKGKDVAHVKALSKGGSNTDGYYLGDRKSNQSFERGSDHKPKKTYDKKK